MIKVKIACDLMVIDYSLMDKLIYKLKETKQNDINSCKKLNLDNCGIESIASDCFEGLENWEELDLRHNKIAILEVNLFNDLKALKKLYIGYTQVVSHNGKMITQKKFETVLNSLHYRSVNVINYLWFH